MSSIDKTTIDSSKIKLFSDGVNLNPPNILVRSKIPVSGAQGGASPKKYLKISIDFKKNSKNSEPIVFRRLRINVTVLLQKT